MSTCNREHVKDREITHLDYIRGLLVMRRITLKGISDSLGVSYQNVSHVLHGRARSRRVQQAVADALGMDFQELWGNQP